jgi:hypothetical protein
VPWVDLRPMTPPDRQALFAAIVGRDRVAAEPDAARRITEYTGGHALAVHVFAQLVRERPGWRLETAARAVDAELTDPFPSTSHECQALPDAIMRTYDTLHPLAARAMRLLGTLPDRPIAAAEVAARLGVPEHHAFFALESLVNSFILEETERDLHYHLTGRVLRAVALRAAHAHHEAGAPAVHAG